ncbi:MAG: NAD-glutamate dehydrogenase [Hyphomicrobiales bacterium]
MKNGKELEKARRIKAAAAMLSADDTAGPDAARFADILFERASAEDLVACEATDLAILARDGFRHLMQHKAGRHDIRIGKGRASAANPAHDVTVVEIANDDMPFLVDSVMGELHELGHPIRLVVHPIFNVERTAKGGIERFIGSGAVTSTTAQRVSLIHVHIDPLEDAADEKALATRLDLILTEVRRVVADWRPMMEHARAAIAGYQTNPPPIPVDEIAEAVQFLQWLVDANFTFLGVREYAYEGGIKRGNLKPTDSEGLGILRNPDVSVLRRGTEHVTMTPEVREFLQQPQPLIITKANVKSRIHRRAHMDYIGVKKYDERGRLAGELRIVGLFTSSAYTRSTRNIPYLRRKVEIVIRRSGYDPHSHSGKALLNVLENYPRDELFQLDEDTLLDFATAIHELDERPRIRVLARRDKFDRFVSVLVFAPRDRYDTATRLKIGAYLAELYKGRISAWYVTYPEGPLARVHFIVGGIDPKIADPEQDAFEAAIAAIIRTWTDTLEAALAARHDPTRAELLAERYADAFSAAYQEAFTPDIALADIDIAEAEEERDIFIDFYRRTGASAEEVALKVYHPGEPTPLSVRVPLLENMGFRVINERTYRIDPTSDRATIHLHDMSLVRADGQPIDLDMLDRPLEECFLAVWNGRAENDGYNALVLNAGLEWRDIAMLRALSRYLRQARIPFSQDYMWGTLNRYPAIAARIARLFHARLDPALGSEAREAASKRISGEIDRELEAVASLDDDRILRRFVNVVQATLRTDFFQRDAAGELKPTIACKLDSRRLDALPLPRPFREIFVYGPRVEGVHLRFGPIARGGLRWSDRAQDFRTEVLGLVKAQQVKNAVIVPVGAKGGFLPKQLPAGGTRDAVQAEGIAAYRIFVDSLIELTDNLTPDGIVPPPDTVRHDGDDPYLVVAADKGTATFSDIANGISEDHHFWLGDAFASGGSAGYDHKKMGITARGAWESVKRHFREIDIDIQTTPFTVAGVGDMSGDVFGNGMLLEQIRLVAAFDHRDIFIDPDPVPSTGFAERRRLFDLPRSSWQDYDKALISKGGGIFPRSREVDRPLLEAAAAIGLAPGKATPQEVMSAILRARVDLLWFGGIGTYVRSGDETDDDVGDRANDAIRVAARTLRTRVVGEGANLGMTQRARIEFGLAGGRCNSDAIDNSAGVNTSDVEVNIKIAFGAAIRAGALTLPARNDILVEMTDAVADLVLRNNYLQTLAISLTERHGLEDIGFEVRLMTGLEGRGLLDRAVEFLPDDAAIAERIRLGHGLTRAELGVLLAYAKLTLFDDLLRSSVPDDAYLGRELYRYFPARMHEEFASFIDGHQLRRKSSPRCSPIR